MATGSYNQNLGADLDRLRFIIGDTDKTDFIFSDEEINGVRASVTSLNQAAGWLLRAMSTDLLRLTQMLDKGGGNVNVQTIISNWDRKAQDWLGS